MDICEIGNEVNAHFFYKFPDDKFPLRMTNGGLTIKVSSKLYEKNVGAKRGIVPKRNSLKECHETVS